MRLLILSVCFVIPLVAEDCRVLVEGAGCRTRQLAMKKIWEALPAISEVKILPREEAPAANHRYFIIRSSETAPTKVQLIAALGRRAKHYKVVSVAPEP